MPSSARLLLSVIALWCSARGASPTRDVQLPVVTFRIYENSSVQLPCQIDDSHSATDLTSRLRWSKYSEEGQKVLLADSEDPSVAESNPRINLWGNQTLELLHVRREDAGAYFCQVTRPEPWGSVVKAHCLTVLYPASAKTVPESGLLEVEMGEEVELKCEIDGSPEPTLGWRFEGEELPTLLESSEPKSLRILVNNQSLAGTYTCVASNGVDDPATADIELKIKHKPEVTASNNWVYGAPGAKVELQCQVSAQPEAKLEWWFDGERLGKLNRYRSTKGALSETVQVHTLVIRSLRTSDLGQYSCRASNEKGQAEASIQVTGVPKPPQLRNATWTGNSYLFVWEVESYSPIHQYQLWFKRVDSSEDWKRLNVPSASDDEGPLYSSSFDLTGLKPDDEYEALVLARNRFGYSNPSKVVRFSANRDSSSEENTDWKQIDIGAHDKIPSVLQVTSDSHRSLAEVSSAASLYGSFLFLAAAGLVPMLFRRLSINSVLS